MEVIDLSGYIEEGQPTLHGETVIWTTQSHEESAYASINEFGDDYETPAIERKLKPWSQEREDRQLTRSHPLTRSIMVNEHGPTHIDAWNHLDPTEKDGSIDNIPLERFFGEAIGVDVSHVPAAEAITVEDIKESLNENDLQIRDGDAITLHTGHRNENYSVTDVEKRETYLNEYTGLDEEAAYWLGDQGISNIGIDAPSIEHSEALSRGIMPAHDMCSEYKVLNMEHLENLEEVAGKRFMLYAFPLKIRGGTGSPIRPVAIME